MADSKCLTTLFSDSVFSSPLMLADSAFTVAVAIFIEDVAVCLPSAPETW
jgi:hypothetical protein